jgi:hypothetical protein
MPSKLSVITSPPLTGATHDDVARIKRVDGGRPRDLACDADDHVPRIGGLPQFAIDAQ